MGCWCPLSCFALEIGIDGPKASNHDSRLEKNVLRMKSLVTLLLKRKTNGFAQCLKSLHDVGLDGSLSG